MSCTAIRNRTKNALINILYIFLYIVSNYICIYVTISYICLSKKYQLSAVFTCVLVSVKMHCKYSHKTNVLPLFQEPVIVNNFFNQICPQNILTMKNVSSTLFLKDLWEEIDLKPSIACSLRFLYILSIQDQDPVTSRFLQSFFYSD